jgi:hypothetical protein
MSIVRNLEARSWALILVNANSIGFLSLWEGIQSAIARGNILAKPSKRLPPIGAPAVVNPAGIPVPPAATAHLPVLSLRHGGCQTPSEEQATGGTRLPETQHQSGSRAVTVLRYTRTGAGTQPAQHEGGNGNGSEETDEAIRIHAWLIERL